MALKGQLNIVQRQEQNINPRLYQAMDLLYMPLLDLQQHLKQELLVNPFLELVEPQEAEDEPKEEEEAPAEGEVDWEKILLDGFEAGVPGGPSEEYEYYERVPVTQITLYDHLRRELFLLKVSDREKRIGEEIIGNINEDGYLTCSVSEVAAASALKELEAGPPSEEEVEAVLRLIQGFDPVGVGARDIRECMLLQLREAQGEEGLTYRIVRDFFPQLSQHKWADIAQALGISPKEVQDLADLIAKLEPKPGRVFAGQPENYVLPDLVAEKVDNDYVVSLNDGNVPRLRRAHTYYQLAQNRKDFKGETKKFIQERLNSANWLIQAIEQRRQTMLKVMNFIVERQREFLDRGIAYLKPLTLREVAEVINMHESTVSRVTNEKYVQTPRGVFSLKFFFSSGLVTDTGEEVSARGVKDQIARFIDREDPAHPATDQAIVRLLKAQGVRIARRTVAKYRDQLGILPARMRKRV